MIFFRFWFKQNLVFLFCVFNMNHSLLPSPFSIFWIDWIEIESMSSWLCSMFIRELAKYFCYIFMFVLEKYWYFLWISGKPWAGVIWSILCRVRAANPTKSETRSTWICRQPFLRAQNSESNIFLAPKFCVRRRGWHIFSFQRHVPKYQRVKNISPLLNIFFWHYANREIYRRS